MKTIMKFDRFNSIIDLIKAFPDEQSCIDHLEDIRWSGKAKSPFDPESTVYICKHGSYRCRNTGKYFNVKTGTIFDNTKLPLQKWFLAIYLITSHKKGISSVQLAKDLDITQKSAWFMLQRIRKAFSGENDGDLNGDVEVDETFVGGKNKNRHKNKRHSYSKGREFPDKTAVIGMMKRGGNLVAKVIPNTQRVTLETVIYNHIDLGSTVHTDEWPGYVNLNTEYDHRIVNHSWGLYGTDESNTNSIEGSWSILKRMIIGIYHKTSRKHLQLYVNEFVFRFNSRKMRVFDRFNMFLENMEHRLTYKALISG